jgi:hypothetical protein
MHKLEVVNSKKHQNIKVSTESDLEINANVHMSHIVLTEFPEVAQYYPIFFSKNTDTGQFQPVALFGLSVDENIYQASDLWKKCYLPLTIQSQPFYLIDDETKDSHNAMPVLAIDSNDNRVQNHQGKALFNNGKASSFLQRKASMLADIAQGFVFNSAFINSLLAQNLLESVELDIKYNDGQEHKINGLYTINKDMLDKVPTSIQQQFEKQGYVSLISDVLSSINHVSTLIDIKNNLANQS